MSELDWAGGFWDGEGSLAINHLKHKSPVLQAGISQNHPEVLERFTAAVGFGKVYGPYTYSYHKNPRWEWAISGTRKVGAFMDVLCPYIGPIKQLQFAAVVCQRHWEVCGPCPGFTSAEALLEEWRNHELVG